MAIKRSSQNTVLLLLLLSTLLATSLVSARRIDCTRFVFAPRCRGVAAKRGQQQPLTTEDGPDTDDTFSDSVLSAYDSSREEDSEKVLRLLMDVSRALRKSAPASLRERELLERLLRS